VTHADGRVLIAQRPPGKHLAGGWEFPGGKLEPGEAREAGLARELHEELGITIATPRPLIRVRHTYPTREVLLDMWVVTRYRGEPRGLDGQALRWCAQEDLPAANLLPADKPIVAALRLPERLREASTPYYDIGDLSAMRRSRAGAEVLGEARLHGVFCVSTDDGMVAATAGADFLVMRRMLADGEIAALCGLVPMPVFALGIELEQAWARGASGVSSIAQ
jgi:mutator protein MutT